MDSGDDISRSSGKLDDSALGQNQALRDDTGLCDLADLRLAAFLLRGAAGENDANDWNNDPAC
jgi:hypothetical protein